MKRRLYQISLTLSGLLIAWAMPAMAAKTASGQENVSGLPQFNIETYPSQVFWLAIMFGALYIFFTKKTLPEISGVIEARKERIDSDLEAAENLREEAEEVQKFYEDSLEKARAEASAFYSEAENTIKEQTAQKYERFRENSAREVAKMEQTIEKAKQKAMAGMNKIAAETAIQAVEKITDISVNLSTARAVIDSLDKTARKKAA